MNKKLALLVVSLPVILSGLDFNAAKKANADSDVFNGITFDYAHTSDESKVGYIDGETLIKQLKKTSTGTSATPFEIEYAKKNYRVRYDKISFEDGIPYNYGKVTAKDSSNTNYYVEGFTTDDYEPVRVDLNNKQYEFSASKARYQTIAVIDENSIIGGDVVYNHHIRIDTETANEILNGAYYAAVNEKKLDDDWNDYQAYLLYEQNLTDYNNYLRAQKAIEIKRANVAAYKAAYQTYLSKEEAYEDYLGELSKYNSKVEKYLTYQDDLYAYNQNKEKIEADKAKYQADMENVNLQLSLMDYFYDADLFANITSDKTIFNCLHTDAVSQVMNESNEGILSIGAKVDGSIFKTARNANAKITEILDAYKADYYKNTAKTDQEKYDFYNKKYLSLKINLEKLTQCLEELFRNPQVRNEMENRGKTAKYKALLAELIFVSNLFEYPSHPAVYKKTDRFIGLDYKIDNKSICEFLGIAEPNLTGKSVSPLGAYPTNPTEVYGDEPAYTDDKYGLTDADFENGQIKKPTEVSKPIEPSLDDFSITEADLTATLDDLDNPVDAKYFDNDGNLIVHNKPATIPTGRHTDDTILSGLFSELKDETLKLQTRFTSASDASVLTFDKEESFRIDGESITESNLAIMWVNPVSGNPYLHELGYYKNSDGSDLVLKHEVPPEAVSGQDGYFNVWKFPDDLSVLAQNGELTINPNVFELDEYTINYFDYEDKDGGQAQPLYTTTGYEMFLPSLEDNDGSLIIPTKASKAPSDTSKKGMNHYTFNSFVDYNGASIEGKKCENLNPNNKVINLYIKFTETYYPNVKFINSINNNVIYEYSDVKPSTRVYCETPKMDPTPSESYQFSHWEVANQNTTLPIEVGSADIVVKAIFTVTHYYNVVFKDEDGTVLSERTYSKVGDNLGEMPVEPEAPVKSFSDNKYYEFAGWDKTVTNVTENVTYTATYANTNIVSGADISRNDSTLTIDVAEGQDSIDVSTLSKLLGEGYTPASAEINFDDGTLMLTETSFKQIYANNIKSIGFTSSVVDGRTVYSLEVIDGNDEETSLNATACIASTNNAHLRAFSRNKQIALDYDDSSITFKINANEDVSIANFYKINADSYSNATFYINGEKFDSKNIPEIEEGSEVVISATPANGYELKKLIVNDGASDIATKDIVNSSDTLTFTISKDVTLRATTSRIQFTITYHIGDQVTTFSGPIGTVVLLPTPSIQDTDKIHYVFTKWEELDAGTVSIVLNGNMELHAEFNEYLLTNAEDVMADSKQIQTIVLASVLGAAAAGFLFGLILLIIKRPKDDDDEDDNSNYSNNSKARGK